MTLDINVISAGVVTPLAAHKATHQNGGTDALNLAGLSGLLADPQTPLEHTQDWSTITGKPPTISCRLLRNSSYVLVSGANYAIPFNYDMDDTYNMHDNTNMTRMICKSAGRYIAGGGFTINNGGAVFRISVGVRRNGTEMLANQHQLTSATTTLYYLDITTGGINLAVNDYLEIVIFQSSGSDKTIDAATIAAQTAMNGWMMKLP